VDFGAVLPYWKADRCVLEHGCWLLEGLLPVQDGLRASMMCWEPATIFQNISTSFSQIIPAVNNVCGQTTNYFGHLECVCDQMTSIASFP